MEAVGRLLTSLVFAEIGGIRQVEFICIDLRIEAVKGIQRDGNAARARIDRTPRRNCLDRINLRFNVFQMPLAKALNGFALQSLVWYAFKSHETEQDMWQKFAPE